MKRSPYKLLVMMLVLLVAISIACSTGGPKATEVPRPTATEAVKAEPTQAAKTELTNAPAAAKGAVSALDDLKNATIQIEAQGTFVDPQVGLVVHGAGRGSGFIIDPSGIAVTNNHVVTGAALLKVWVGGNKEKVYSAKVLGASECSDLAVIKIEGSDFPYLQWYDGQPKVGLEVYAAGYPLGDPEYTLTKGIVSKANADGKTSWASVGSVIEHDARINPGNSGGPLVDKEGKIVGINYASNHNNQYFAIARTEADALLSQLKDGADVNSIGVNGQAVVTDDQSLSGVWVASVKSGSPADKSGVQSGDILIQMEGLVLATDGTMADYCQILRSHKPTDTLSLTLLRWQSQELLEGQLNGREMKVTAKFDGSQASNGTDPNSGIVTVADDSNVITIQAPADWQMDGSAWQSSWSIGSGSYPFTAQTLTVSPDVKAYGDGWDTPGIFIGTSRDWGDIGGYANLLEGVADFYKDCRPNGRQNYKDDSFEGIAQLYAKCGTNKTNALVMAVRPVQNPQSYLVLIEMKYATTEEFDVLGQLLGTAEVNP
jgi:serine protease Do